MYKFIAPVFAALFLFAVGCTGENAEQAGEMHADTDGEHMEMTANEMLLEELEAHRAEFVASLEGLSDEQLNYRESADRWSILEVAEHIVTADQGIAAGFSATLEAGPNPEAKPDSSASAEMISGMLSDRSQTFDAPAEFIPSGKYDSVEDVIAAFDESHQVFVDAVSNEEMDLTQYYAENPVFGMIDASKWITFSTAHGQRHLDQIQQVKDHDGYPSAGA